MKEKKRMAFHFTGESGVMHYILTACRPYFHRKKYEEMKINDSGNWSFISSINLI